MNTIKTLLFILTVSAHPLCFCYSFKKISLFTDQQLNLQQIQHRGPSSVIRSLCCGLSQLKIPFNYNPHNQNDVGDIVIVLSDIHQLTRAMHLKHEKKINRLLAGPLLMVRSNEYNHIAASPEIDMYLVNSIWTKISYIEDEPSLKAHIAIWPAGINENYWKPTTLKDPINNHHVLVYQKTNNNQLVQNVQNLLKKYNFQAINIVYGSYNIEQYKQALEQSLFAIVIGNSESQGIALAEAWAMNVPTLVYNLRKYSASGKTFTINSFCPYLTDKTGIDWRELDELEGWIKSMPLCINEFSPRSWVLENMTDVVCTKKLLDLITRL